MQCFLFRYSLLMHTASISLLMHAASISPFKHPALLSPFVPILSINAHRLPLTCCPYSPLMPAASTQDKNVIIWTVDPESHQLSKSMLLPGHVGPVAYLAWNPHGDKLLAVCEEGRHRRSAVVVSGRQFVCFLLCAAKDGMSRSDG